MEQDYRDALRAWRTAPDDVEVVAALARLARRSGTRLPPELDAERVFTELVARLHEQVGRGNEEGYCYTAVGDAVALRPPFEDLEAVTRAVNALPRLHAQPWADDAELGPMGLAYPCVETRDVQRLPAGEVFPHKDPALVEEVGFARVLAAFPAAEVYQGYGRCAETDGFTTLITLLWLPSVEHAHLIVIQYHWGHWTPEA